MSRSCRSELSVGGDKRRPRPDPGNRKSPNPALRPAPVPPYPSRSPGCGRGSGRGCGCGSGRGWGRGCGRGLGGGYTPWVGPEIELCPEVPPSLPLHRALVTIADPSHSQTHFRHRARPRRGAGPAGARDTGLRGMTGHCVGAVGEDRGGAWGDGQDGAPTEVTSLTAARLRCRI